EMILREIYDNPRINYMPVGILDDDRRKWGSAIHGVRILGNLDHLSEITDRFDEILIAVPSATGAQMRHIVAACEKTDKPFKTMPPVGELIGGRVSMKVARNVTLSDIVGREEVRLDEENISKYLMNKRVLVTGAGGSIGSELVRQVSLFKPQAIALLDFSELNLYQVELDIRKRFKDMTIHACLVDLRNLHTTRRIFDEFKPDVVFHAAAYKHVPLQELNPWEALSNNLLGTKHAVECSIDCGVEKFVLVSSDKAVRPSNIMGASKRICELLSGSVNGKSSAKFVSVRFGNVLGSSGSVIPLFQQQIALGGPLTVTHPEITRYFMSIPEAAQLILQAGAMAEGGEIFILKMGDPVRITDLARSFIRLHGFEPEKDIEIVFTGLRPGEKLYEELITEGEGIVPTNHEKIMVLRGDGCDYDSICQQIKELIDVANSFDVGAIRKKIKEIVPEYMPQG
ncbi:MAG TPA: polysaccharide biosynthesis protein, partial [Desulfobacteraceae bacterium]|nr:polysaccharide biosynthesis protein [Desulfobacteraceae bacterium]